MIAKHILLVIDSMGIGGAERVVLTQARLFLDRGHHVSLIVCDDIVKFDIDPRIDLHVLGFKKSFMDYTRYSKKIYSMIDNIEVNNGFTFNLIFAHLQKATKLLKRYRHKNIYHIIHNTLSQSAFKNRTGIRLFVKKKSLQRIYDNLNVITVSEGVKEDLVSVVGVKTASIRTIYNPISTDEVYRLSKEQLEIQEKNFIVHVGRFHSQKRHDILLRAFKKANLDTKLILVGDGEEKKNILDLVKELRLEDKVILTGFITNPYPLIKNAKLLILTSEYEGFGVVLAEALALKKPIISTNCKSGPNEILTGENKKYLVKVNDIDDISKKLQEVYWQADEIVTNLPERFNSSLIIDQYLKLESYTV